MRHLTWEFLRYLPIGKKDRQWGLYVTGAGRVVDATPDYDYSQHPPPYYSVWDKGWVLPDYALIYIIRGQGEFESELTGHRAVPAGSVILLFPEVWHRYRPCQDTPWTEYWVTFGGDYLKGLVRRGVISPRKPLLETGLDEAIFHPYRCLLDRVRSEPPALQQLIAANTMEILGAALAAGQARPERAQLTDRVERAKLVLQQRIEQEVDMEQLAASLGLSYERFRHVFKQQTGMAPCQYHLQLRIDRAKELLRETPLSVHEIAVALAFVEPAHFSNIFKRKVGMPPSQWRTEARGGG